MKRTLAVGISFFSFIASAMAQESMKMTGMENSVGYLSSGTSIEPRRTSESSPMVHKNPWRLGLHVSWQCFSSRHSAIRAKRRR